MSGCQEHWSIQPQTDMRAKVYRVITMHARPRQTNRQTDRQTNGRTSRQHSATIRPNERIAR